MKKTVLNNKSKCQLYYGKRENLNIGPKLPQGAVLENLYLNTAMRKRILFYQTVSVLQPIKTGLTQISNIQKANPNSFQKILLDFQRKKTEMEKEKVIQYYIAILSSPVPCLHIGSADGNQPYSLKFDSSQTCQLDCKLQSFPGE